LVPSMNGAGPFALFGARLGAPTVSTAGIRYPDSRIHAPNENVRLDDFVLGVKHVAAIIGKMK
jgi:acetylornithine deacetylase/succinyl-diaminopimelate desuccinylase-like protein